MDDDEHESASVSASALGAAHHDLLVFFRAESREGQIIGELRVEEPFGRRDDLVKHVGEVLGRLGVQRGLDGGAFVVEDENASNGFGRT